MLWGALNNATQAMMATSWQMGSISQNIANVNTVGYKNKETLFKTLLSETKAAPNNGLNIFTVKAADRVHIQSQGVITPTSHWSDLAINGRGFFMVANPSGGTAPTTVDTNDPNGVYYTRAGQFHQVAGAGDRNYFMTEGGQHLLGWQADADGVVTEGMLTAVYTLPQTTIPARATTTATIKANLPAESALSATQTTRQVVDPNGVQQTMTLNWTRTGMDTWSVAATVPGGTTTALPNVTMDGFRNVSSPFNAAAATTPVDERWDTSVTIDWDDGTYGAAAPNLVDTFSIKGMAPPPTLQKISLEVFDATGNSHTAQLGFERVGANTWNLFTDTGLDGVTGTPQLIEFDANGQMTTASPTTLSLTFDDNGVQTTTSVAVDLSGISQYNDATLHIGSIDQDGYKTGNMRYARFNGVGDLEGTYDNGQTRVLFKVPVATFVSENNLNPVSGTLFQRSLQAGDLTIGAIDDAAGGGGYMTANSVENSTVEIEDEFTKMIMTQKAYSTNATVFKTADEMTTVARDLK